MHSYIICFKDRTRLTVRVDNCHLEVGEDGELISIQFEGLTRGWHPIYVNPHQVSVVQTI